MQSGALKGHEKFGTSLKQPIWDITEALWIDHPPNRRFAIWSTGTNSPLDDAVFDKETALVWERSPATDRKPFDAAVVYSTTRVVAQRKGWRLPALGAAQLGGSWRHESDPASGPSFCQFEARLFLLVRD